MKKILCVGALALFGLATQVLPAVVVAPGGGGPSNRVTVELNCRPGLRASAAGAYGGIGFGLACINGRARVNLPASGDTTYSVRIGVESDSTAFDCFFSGDSAIVNESCAGVLFRVR